MSATTHAGRSIDPADPVTAVRSTTGPLSTPPFVRTWTAWVTAGEFAGFCGPALVGALVWNRAPEVALPALIAAGSIEGAVLGWSQARVLRRRLPVLSARRWVLGTAIAAAAAWGIGMVPSTAHDVLAGWPVPLLVLAGVAAAIALLGSIGFAQWLELRRHVVGAESWIAASAGAWCVGLAAFFAITTPLWQPGQDAPLIAAIGALGGLCMAATMAWSTGLALRRLLRRNGLLSPR